MYRHNPLPQNIQRPKIRRSIVFSSPKFDRFYAFINKKKLSKSQSRQRSIHQIYSKQKPKMLFSPVGKRRNFQISTSGGKQSSTLPFSRNDNKIGEFSDSRFISVSDLLQKRNINTSQNIESFLSYQQKNPSHSIKLKIVRLFNTLGQDTHKKLVRIKQLQKFLAKFDLNSMIQNDCWQFYEGQISQQISKFHGYGRITMVNGDNFMGFFQHGKPEGHGTYQMNGHDSVNGIWHKGHLIQIL